MSKVRFLIFMLVASMGWSAFASKQGDEFIRLGQAINQNTNLTPLQISQLDKVLTEAQDALNNTQSDGGYICIQGTLYGPNGLQVWMGDSGACEDPAKVNIGKHYACAVGTLYGPNGLKKWTGFSDACGDSSKVKIGDLYACAVGTIYGPNGFEKWTGDSNYCSKAILN